MLVAAILLHQGRIDVGVAVDLVAGVLQEGEVRLQVLGLVRRRRGLESRVVLNHAIRTGRLAARRLHVINGGVLQGQPRDIGNMQGLRAALVYFVLWALEVAYEPIAVAILVHGGREHYKPISRAATLLQKRRYSLGQQNKIAIESPIPTAPRRIPMLHQTHAL